MKKVDHFFPCRLGVVETQIQNNDANNPNPYFSSAGKEKHPKQKIGHHNQDNAERQEIQTKDKDTASTVTHFLTPLVFYMGLRLLWLNLYFSAELGQQRQDSEPLYSTLMNERANGLR
ncbi:MAG: hypothetical protein HOP27_03095 [Anaerolineales bacterium]|nr:hypothetical protein [Anaerolineales bacterium]